MTRLLSALTLACLLWPLTGASRELPPAPGTPKPFELPEKDTVTLGNGLRLTFLEYGSVPLVTLQAVIRTGAIDDDGQTWIDDLVADMLKEGTTHRSAEAIAREAADMGGSVSTGSGAEQGFVDVSVLSENAVEA
ncbi:MAG: insulinase family protein, partial [Steroidobacteraceae bacterium]